MINPAALRGTDESSLECRPSLADAIYLPLGTFTEIEEMNTAHTAYSIFQDIPLCIEFLAYFPWCYILCSGSIRFTVIVDERGES